jgi:hypothetical protein
MVMDRRRDRAATAEREAVAGEERYPGREGSQILVVGLEVSSPRGVAGQVAVCQWRLERRGAYRHCSHLGPGRFKRRVGASPTLRRLVVQGRRTAGHVVRLREIRRPLDRAQLRHRAAWRWRRWFLWRKLRRIFARWAS